jgi:hypothetical protein
VLVKVGRKKSQIELHESTTSSDELSDTPKEKRPFFVYDGDKNSKIINTYNINHIESMNRIFGANKTSFRANADDGLLCGVLLLPMVATAKLVDASKRNADTFNIGKKNYIS